MDKDGMSSFNLTLRGLSYIISIGLFIADGMEVFQHPLPQGLSWLLLGFAIAGDKVIELYKGIK